MVNFDLFDFARVIDINFVQLTSVGVAGKSGDAKQGAFNLGNFRQDMSAVYLCCRADSMTPWWSSTSASRNSRKLPVAEMASWWQASSVL